MANNRIFLVYRPLKLAVYLGKSLADGWYDVPEDLQVRIETLFERAQGDGAFGIRGDDFAVAMENADGAPNAIEIDYSGWEMI